jgi:hypothetical protein
VTGSAADSGGSQIGRAEQMGRVRGARQVPLEGLKVEGSRRRPDTGSNPVGASQRPFPHLVVIIIMRWSGCWNSRLGGLPFHAVHPVALLRPNCWTSDVISR